MTLSSTGPYVTATRPAPNAKGRTVPSWTPRSRKSTGGAVRSGCHVGGGEYTPLRSCADVGSGQNGSTARWAHRTQFPLEHLSAGVRADTWFRTARRNCRSVGPRPHVATPPTCGSPTSPRISGRASATEARDQIERAADSLSYRRRSPSLIDTNGDTTSTDAIPIVPLDGTRRRVKGSTHAQPMDRMLHGPACIAGRGTRVKPR